jgi:hypothetical protein
MLVEAQPKTKLFVETQPKKMFFYKETQNTAHFLNNTLRLLTYKSTYLYSRDERSPYYTMRGLTPE